MCEPMTLAVAGLNAVGTLAGISAQNSASASNQANALSAMNDAIGQEQQSFIEQNRSLIQGGFDAVLAGREAESTAYTSALQNGVKGNSVKAALRDARRATGKNRTRTQQEVDSLGDQTAVNLTSIRSTAQSRINSTPRTSFGLGDLTGILAPIVKSELE